MNAQYPLFTPRAGQAAGNSIIGSHRLRLAGVVILLLTNFQAQATPDRQVTVEEQFLGSNETGFVTLRTETDNLTSYYAYRTKRYLDEYTKHGEKKVDDTTIAPRTRSTLLLDVTTSIDPTHIDPLTAPVRTEKVNAKDDSVALSDILRKYPAQAEKWSAGLFTKLSTNQTGGVNLGNLNVVWGGTITQKVFGIKSPKLEWTLDEVTQDLNCVYLRVSMGVDAEGRQSRLVCLSPRLTRQLRDHLSLEPFYMSAGSYPTEKEARDKAVALILKSRENHRPAIGVSIWTMSKNTGKTDFVIVVCGLPEAGKEDSLAILEKRLGVHLLPQSSSRFQERIPVIEPPTKPANPSAAPNAPPKLD